MEPGLIAESACFITVSVASYLFYAGLWDGVVICLHVDMCSESVILYFLGEINFKSHTMMVTLGIQLAWFEKRQLCVLWHFLSSDVLLFPKNSSDVFMSWYKEVGEAVPFFLGRKEKNRCVCVFLRLFCFSFWWNRICVGVSSHVWGRRRVSPHLLYIPSSCESIVQPFFSLMKRRQE